MYKIFTKLYERKSPRPTAMAAHALNQLLYETLSIFNFERTIFYTVNSIDSINHLDLFIINFVYTLCSSTPGQIRHGRFIRALGDMIRDQVRILYLLFYGTSLLPPGFDTSFG